MKTRRIAPLLLLFTLAACARQPAAIRPGAVDQFDSDAYDTLLIASASLEGAKVSYASGVLPLGSKPLINAAIIAYNNAQGLWHQYHTDRDVGSREGLEAAIRAMTPAIAAIFTKSSINAGTLSGVE